MYAILKGKDDHKRIFLVKDFGRFAPRKINKEEQVGEEGRAIFFRGREWRGIIFFGGEAKKFVGDLKIFCMQNKPKKPKNFPPAAGGQGGILRLVILITFFYLTFQGVKF